MLIDAWANVYDGNASSHKEFVKAFKVKYGKLLFTRKTNGKQEKFKLNPVKGADVKATCREAKFSAPGLDQWATQDCSILSDEAYGWLASMFNTIEAGAQWPEPTRHAKGVYLLKDPDGKGDPLNYMLPPRHFGSLQQIRSHQAPPM